MLSKCEHLVSTLVRNSLLKKRYNTEGKSLPQAQEDPAAVNEAAGDLTDTGSHFHINRLSTAHVTR